MLFHFPAKQPGWQQNMGEVCTCINRPSTNYWPIVDSLVKKLWSVSQVSYVSMILHSYVSDISVKYQLFFYPRSQTMFDQYIYQLIVDRYWLSRIGGRPSWNNCEMFIIFGSVSTKTEKIIPRDYFSGTEKARNNLFQKTFFFLLNMMHQSSLVEMSNYKDTSTQTI